MPIPRIVNALFFHDTPRLYILRIVITAALGALLVTLPSLLQQSDSVLWILLFVLVAVHHLLSIVEWRFFVIPIDLALILFETAAIAFYAHKLGLFTWYPETLILHIAFSWVVFCGLSLLAIFRIATLFRSWRSPFTPSFILWDKSRQSASPWSVIKMLFGREVWDKQFAGEHLLVRSFRAILGIIFLGGIFFYILTNVIYGPLREDALSPVKEIRAFRTPADFKIDPPIWNIIPFALILADNPAEVIFSAVDVVPIWSSAVPENLQSPCSKFLHETGEASFQCTMVDPVSYAPLTSLLISANFSKLGTGILLESPTPALNFMIGTANESVPLIAGTTSPFALIPGVNLVGSITLEIRETFTKSALATLGIFTSSVSFWTSRITSVYPDPSQSVTRSENISTLRLFFQEDLSDFRVLVDYRDNSVVSGFSDVGGLWTTLSGIFTLFFGGSLLSIIYGSKPLSLFGIAHRFHREQMAEQFKEKYPQLESETKSRQSEGLLAFLQDHFLELDFLNDQVGANITTNLEDEKSSNPDRPESRDIESGSNDRVFEDQKNSNGPVYDV